MSFQSEFISKIWERGKTDAAIGAVYDLQAEALVMAACLSKRE
ncbi:hypothetical protein STRDD11_02283 [Streptococcus sp. DD11]|nr:hypothetical protein [Streptococcus sp. DD11]KXT79394.1 hypothetical protein STRDD11_02283 [Streptococcus sp. DD11]